MQKKENIVIEKTTIFEYQQCKKEMVPIFNNKWYQANRKDNIIKSLDEDILSQIFEPEGP
jgi:hypothetical protein